MSGVFCGRGIAAVRNGHIRGTAQVEEFEDKVIEGRLRLFGHVQRADHVKYGAGRQEKKPKTKGKMDVLNGDMQGWCDRRTLVGGR